MYTRMSTIEHVRKSLQPIERLYQKNCVKWAGTTTDTRERLSEVVAKALLDLGVKELLAQILPIKRKRAYKVHAKERMRPTAEKSPRREEILARQLYRNLSDATLGPLGRVREYQVPLKSTSKKGEDSGVGKIDLISKEGGGAFHLIELKFDNGETLLRAVLEVATYYHQLDHKGFLRDFGQADATIKKSVALFELRGCTAIEEAKELLGGKRPQLARLVRELEVGIYQLHVASAVPLV